MRIGEKKQILFHHKHHLQAQTILKFEQCKDKKEIKIKSERERK